MIIEFESVGLSLNRQKEIEEAKKLTEDYSEGDIEESNDTIFKYYLEMDNVVDFVEGDVSYKDDTYECVFAVLTNGDYSSNIFLSANAFKKILEKTRGISIPTAKELLK